jgi:gamma-glutamyltranspeptidase/glutathione hydrolase
LNILEGYDLAALEYNSPQAIHVQVEALKLAFADREAYVGDPVHVDVPVAGLLSREYAALRRGLIDPNQARAVYPPGDPRKMLAVAPDYRPQLRPRPALLLA